MKKIIYPLIFIILLIFSSVFIWNRIQKTMNTEPTLSFKILTDHHIDKEIQINIRKINDMNNINSNKNHMFTLLRNGIYYPLNNKYDFKMYEIFVKKKNKFAYISGENIYFIEDEYSIRGNNDRSGEVLIYPYEKDGDIFFKYNQYHNSNKTEHTKKFRLKESYKFNSHIFNEQTKLEDFSLVNIPE